MSGAFRLGPNQYGKAEVRIVKITRDTATHEIEDLSVTSQLRGDFSASHLTGDNSHVVPTDTQKNTVYGLVREHGIGSPEAFLLRLGDHFSALAAQLRQPGIGWSAPPRQIGVTACLKHEGVSTIAAHLALAAAQMSDDSVLLIDAHLNDPSVHRLDTE